MKTKGVIMNPKPKVLTILDIVSVILFLEAAFMAVSAPLEAVMGWVQKVFYFHVATAWTGMMGFMVAGIAGIIYLWKKDLKWDIVEVAAVEISMVFFGITIVMGSIWARPIWNTWWTWDPRLTTAAITMLVYAAYMMLRQGIEDPERRARFGAVYTILGFVAVPITFISIRLLRTIHPVVIGEGAGSGDGSFAMTDDMRTVFFFSLFVFTLLFIDFLWHRIRMGQLAAKVEQLRLKVSG
jgi:heme exporter protein C